MVETRIRWTCAWCWRWNDPECVACGHCGRDIEAPAWYRIRHEEGAS